MYLQLCSALIFIRPLTELSGGSRRKERDGLEQEEA